MKKDLELRDCIVNGRKVLFHKWVNKAMSIRDVFGEVWNTYIETFGLVEYEDGTVCLVDPQKIRFIK